MRSKFGGSYKAFSIAQGAYTINGGLATEQGEVTEVRPAHLALLSKPHEYLSLCKFYIT